MTPGNGSSRTPEPDAGGHVLIVDDNEDVREAMADILRGRGYRVIVADGGAQAVSVMSARGTKLCLVLLDWLMPEMGGGAVIDWMGLGGRPEDIPVYVLTASPELVTAKVPVLRKSDVLGVLEVVRRHCGPVACCDANAGLRSRG